MKLTTIEIRSKKIDIEVASDGEFSAEFNGQRMKGVTVAALREKLERAVKSAKVSIPFLQWDGEQLRRGACTGIHYGNSNLLIKWDGVKGVEQVWGLDGAIDPKHLAEYQVLCDAAAAAEANRKRFEEKHGFGNMKERVRKELEAAG